MIPMKSNLFRRNIIPTETKRLISRPLTPTETTLLIFLILLLLYRALRFLLCRVRQTSHRVLSLLFR